MRQGFCLESLLGLQALQVHLGGKQPGKKMFPQEGIALAPGGA